MNKHILGIITLLFLGGHAVSTSTPSGFVTTFEFQDPDVGGLDGGMTWIVPEMRKADITHSSIHITICDTEFDLCFPMGYFNAPISPAWIPSQVSQGAIVLIVNDKNRENIKMLIETDSKIKLAVIRP